MSNKYSRYLNGLVSYIKDTKPFHSKLTEVQEVYQFSESMNVDIRENWRWDILMKAYWLYEYYSDGRATNTFGGNRRHPIHFINSPMFRGGSGSYFKVGRDESKSLDFIPHAYDDCVYSLSDVVINRNDRNLFLHQGIDYHKSYGAQVFRIRQTHKIGFKEWCGKQTFTTSWATDGQHPVIKEVLIENADDIRIRSGNAIKLNSTQIKILTPGTVVVDGYVSESYFPLIQEKQDEAVMTESVNAVKEIAMQKTNPNSSYSRLKSLFAVIQFQIDSTSAPNSQLALTKLQTLIETKIPDDFEELVVYLEAENVPLPSGFSGWRGVDATVPLNDQKYMETVLYSHSPNLLQNYFTDRGQWEYAGVTYESIKGKSFEVFNIVPNYYATNFEEWAIVAYDSETLSVSGSTSGLVGSVKLGERFTSNAISFSTKSLSGATVETSDTILLTPINKIVVHGDAPLEAWSIIKTDPFGYSRPSINSTRYANVEDLDGNLGTITVLEKTVKDGTIIVSKISQNTASVIHEQDERINGVVSFGEVYNDGFIAFKLNPGSTFKFADDELIIIDIENIPPYAQELSICYSYDCDGFDADTAVYNTVDDPYKAYFKKFEFGFDGTKFYEGGVYEEDSRNYLNDDAVQYVQDFLRRIEFGYDSRFLGYDFTSFNLKFTSDEVADNLNWRLRAKPDFSKPLKLHADTPSNKFNLIASNSPGDAFAPAIYDAPDSQVDGEGERSSNDPDYDVDLFLYYSSEFALEYYDESSLAWIIVDNHIPINTRYSNDTYNLEFTIVPASKEFIGAEVHSSWYENGEIQQLVTHGGDWLTWTTKNPFPKCVGAFLMSDKAPRVLMHPSGFSNTDEFLWRLNFNSPNSYSLQGIGQQENSGVMFDNEPVSFDVNGFSYKNRIKSIHYTLIPNEYGFDAGDVVSFYTYKSRPNYLVYGSVSGWQQPAEYNKYYWNGKIGFKITPPSFTFYEGVTLINGDNNTWEASDGVFKVNWTAYNIVDTEYKISRADDRWVLIRDGQVVSSGTSELDDGFINISVPVDKFSRYDYTISVDSDDFDYAFGQDLTIMKSRGFRNVRVNDELFIERSRNEEMFMHLTEATNKHELFLEGMPVSTFDLTTRQEPNVMLSEFSPEVQYYTSWVPLTTNGFDIRSSTNEFRDTATEYDIYSTASGNLLGTIKPTISNDLQQPSEFIFDVSSHEHYLPLNSSVHFLTKNSGPDETIGVAINEKLRWFVLGGIGGLDAMFDDDANVSMTDSNQIFITANYENSISTILNDNNFQGFLPGYDNLPFDAEIPGYWQAGTPPTDFGVISNSTIGYDENVLGAPSIGLYFLSPITGQVYIWEGQPTGWVLFNDPSAGGGNGSIGGGNGNPDTIYIDSQGYYDAGVVLTDFFQEARFLLISPDRTDVQDQRLAILLDLINPWVDLGDLTLITLNSFLDRVRNAPPSDEYLSNLVNYNLTNSFGVPNSGLAASIQENSTSSSSADFKELFTLNSKETGGFDSFGMGMFGFDSGNSNLSMITLKSIIGSPVFTSFEDFEGIESHFGNTIRLTGEVLLFNKKVWVWMHGDASPRQVQTRVLNSNTIEVDLHAARNGKIAVF